MPYRGELMSLPGTPFTKQYAMRPIQYKDDTLPFYLHSGISYNLPYKDGIFRLKQGHNGLM